MTGEGEQTLRQRRTAATALNIETQAVALALEHGLDHVTVEMICEASEVSARTFFNYFGTKDNAILGKFAPEVDEQKAREFIASNNPDILSEVIGVVKLPDDFLQNPGLELQRMKLLNQNPGLMSKQMERFSDVPAQIEDILFLRLRRVAEPDESEEQTRAYAALTSELIALTFRNMMTQAIQSNGVPSGIPSPQEVVKNLKQVMARLSN
jgi:AcrR family transcriptional regulator